MEARRIKTGDEIRLLTQAASMVDAAYEELYRFLRPGVRENEAVGLVAKTLYDLGSEYVEGVNAISGERCSPHPHVFSDRLIRPGDPAFFDILHSFNGYRTCYYRTFAVGSASSAQKDAYTRAREYMDRAIALVKPGATTADIVQVWPTAQEFGFADEEAAFALQYGHGVGLSIWEKPIFSRLVSLDHPETLQSRAWSSPSRRTGRRRTDWGAARIEEEVVVTADGCEVITKFPAEELHRRRPALLLRRGTAQHDPRVRSRTSTRPEVAERRSRRSSHWKRNERTAPRERGRSLFSRVAPQLVEPVRENLGVAIEFNASASDVPTQDALGLFAIATLDRLEQEFVFEVCDLDAAFAANELHEDPTVGLRRVPQALDEFGQRARLHAGVRNPVKLTIETHERLEIGRLLHALDQVGRAGQIFCAEKRQVVAEQQGLESFPNLVLLGALVLGEAGHPRARIRHHVDEPVGDKNAQGFANGNATRAELLREFLLPNALTGRELAGQNRLSQLIRNACAEHSIRGSIRHRHVVAFCSSVLLRRYCAGCAGCHNFTGASFSYALPCGKLTSSNCMPHGLKKYTQR
jgi:hypothetical protein